MTFPETVRHFQARRIAKGKYIALCPHHRDRKPSLSIREGHSTALIKCMSQGCSLVEICKASGIRVTDLWYETTESPSAIRRALRKREQDAACADMVAECRRTLIYRRDMWAKVASALAWKLFRDPSNIGLAEAYEKALDCSGGQLTIWQPQHDPLYTPFPVKKLLDGVTVQSLGQTSMAQTIARLLKLPA